MELDAIVRHGRLLLQVIIIRVINVCLHMLGVQKKEDPIVALLWTT
jgi:hypothetical protein